MDYTIVGKEVNAASRLESSADPDEIRISESTYQLVNSEIQCELVGKVQMKGIKDPVNTYRVG